MSEANYHTTTWFSEILLAIEMKEIKVKMNKPVDLRISVLQISKTLICELWYDFIKPNYQQNEKLCYIDTDSFIIYIKTEDVYEDIANDVEKRFDNQIMKSIDHYQKEKTKDELGGKMMTDFAGVRPKTYFYSIYYGEGDKKAKGTKNV